LVSQSVLGDARHGRGGYVVELIGGVSVTGQDDMQSTGERRTYGRADTHLGEEAPEDDVRGAPSCQQVAEVGAIEGVVASLAQHKLVRGWLYPEMQVPTRRSWLVDVTWPTVVLNVHHQDAGSPRSKQQSGNALDQGAGLGNGSRTSDEPTL
jgi:hypothetical protein